MSGRSGQAVSEWRRRTKAKLVAHHGGQCVDCGYVGPPFMYDFDHRDPTEKLFAIGSGASISYDRQLAESEKCDLVCASCHRMRTHLQRCLICEYCSDHPRRSLHAQKAQ
ncbi:HNH endonuclease [Gordonia phage Bachita]|uniref:HNH endonuclease n=1 Tax=Gordonia phage Bachita TaxID=1838061 RepID=A0A166YC35_9CAUD|nr:HNH endonuclease [Gordonia phage Bachita]ANA86867.1 HNH endonuclease [Gordonia phage Bachita]